MIDTSVFCGHWPFRRLPAAHPAALKQRLLALGMTQAWIAPLEAVFYQDAMEANELLHHSLHGDPYFIPVGVIDLSLPAWRKDAVHCLEKLGCKALKLLPNYHRFDLNSASSKALCELAREANVPVCVQLRMQDERGHHPLVKVPGVPAKDLLELARQAPRTRFLACAGYRNELKDLREAPNVWAEISFCEWELSLRTAINAFGHERLVFGSHSPLFYPEAVEAKLDVVPGDFTLEDSEKAVQGIRENNARELLGS